jgi:transposase
MNQKRQYKTYTKAFKEEAVALVIDQGYTVPDTAQSLGIRANLLYGWKQQFEDKQSGNVLNTDECSELMKLRKENKQPRLLWQNRLENSFLNKNRIYDRILICLMLNYEL